MESAASGGTCAAGADADWEDIEACIAIV